MRRLAVTLFCILALLGFGAAARAETLPERACRAIDGDTIRCGGERIRISNIDAPELGHHARCAVEADLAERAKRFTAARLAAGPIDLSRDARRSRDRYGRTLARVRSGGEDLGDALVAAGLARRWDGRRHPWC